MADPRRILLDIQEELDGNLLEEEFEIGGRLYRMKMLNESELRWATNFSDGDATNELTFGMSMMVPLLSVGIRSIDGTPLSDIFADEWSQLPSDTRDSLRHKYLSEDSAKKFFSAGLFKKFLEERPPSFSKSLLDKWNILQGRQREAQSELKNS
jgi:hypothetical protein